MTMQARGNLARYGAAVAFVALATGLRFALNPLLGSSVPYALAFVAVAAAAWYGGLGPALLAAALGGGSSFWLFVPPRIPFALGNGGGVPGLAVFLLASSTILGFSEGLRRERQRSAAAERERERLNQRLESLVDNTPLAVVEWDGDFQITRWSGEAEAVFGWRADEVTGRRIDSFRLVHEQDGAKLGQVMQRLLDPAERFVVSRQRNRTKWGEERHCEWYNSVFRDEHGRLRAVLSLVLDVTGRERLEATLRQADRRKDEFLATLAHELRNPLAPMRNALEIMRLAGRDSGAAERARALIERQLAQMVRLIDDLLDVSRISLGRLELRRSCVDLAAVVASAVETSRPLIESSGHELTVSLPREPVYVDGDLTRLAQVLVNLLNNAARYMEAGGRIRLSVHRDGERALVRVSDDGVGISAEMLPHVFSLFATGSRFARRAGAGLGIGLTLVKQLVDLHGGTIEAQSGGPGRGSDFVVGLATVPGPAPASRPAKPGRDGRPGPARRILVVDDNGDAAVSLATMLQMMGHETHTAHDGPSALAEAARRRPQIVLLDIGMPGMSGYEVAVAIRHSPWGRGMALVALTGWGQEEDRRRSREAGFDEHLVKPVHPELLAGVIAGLPVAAN